MDAAPVLPVLAILLSCDAAVGLVRDQAVDVREFPPSGGGGLAGGGGHAVDRMPEDVASVHV